jgi:DNA mismatch repair protein MutL
LEALGIVCAEFGPARFVLRSLPADAELDTLATALPELLREAAEEGEAWRERLLASLACRAAVRKGRRLAQAEALDLIERLGATRSPAVCPHGSPVMLVLADSALQRGFGWS